MSDCSVPEALLGGEYDLPGRLDRSKEMNPVPVYVAGTRQRGTLGALQAQGWKMSTGTRLTWHKRHIFGHSVGKPTNNARHMCTMSEAVVCVSIAIDGIPSCDSTSCAKSMKAQRACR